MKLYVIMVHGTQYNDEYDEVQEGGAPVKAYTKKENAQIALHDAEVKARDGVDLGDHHGALAYIEEIDVADADVIKG